MNSKKNFLGMLLICDKLIVNGNIQRDPKNPDNILVWKTGIEPEGFYSVNIHTAMSECYNDEKQFEDFIAAAEKVGVDTGKLFLEAYFRLHLTNDSFHSWDDLYKAAEGKAFKSPELIAKDNAREDIKDFLLKNENINIDDLEIPEEAIDSYDAIYHFLFDDEGHMVSYEKELSNPYDAAKTIHDMKAREIFAGMNEAEKEALYLMLREEKVDQSYDSMSDLISRSKLLEELTNYEEELQRDRQEAIETDDEYMQFAIMNQDTAIGRIKRCVMNMPTAYNSENEKQIPKKPSPIDYKKYIDVVKNAKFLRGGFWCPNCKHVVYSGCYCADCGQKLDWSDENE